jgi:molybdenum storage protein
MPPHRTDSGTILTAEVLGARRCILVKDERGLITADPKKTSDAEFIQEIVVSELKKLELNDLPVERAMLDSLERSRSVQEVIIINGLESGNLARALSGDNPGTRIYKKNAQRIA